MSSTLLLLLTAALLALCGAVWPKPLKSRALGGSPLTLCNNNLVVQSNSSSPVLKAAVARYAQLIFSRSSSPPCSGREPRLALSVAVTGSTGDTLNSQTDESYTLLLSASQSNVTAVSVYGALHALETLAQLVQRNPVDGSMSLPQVEIVDAPRFSFRGFLHDTSRHFLSVKVIKQLIDALSASKFNVFHWHIVDDQSFPYVSTALPKLSQGAWGGLKSHTYSPAQVQDIISYGRERGVRVVPEFDTPGHTASWGVGYPNWVTPCYSGSQPNGQVGPLNPTLNSTFDYLKTLYSELNKVFPDDYVHMGGDEVSFDCWKSNPGIQAWMAARNWTDYALLEQYYEQSLIQIVQATGKHYVVWQEIFDNGLQIDKHTIVDVWKGEGWQAEIGRVTQAGFQAILSAPWYLNRAPSAYDCAGCWEQYYAVEPTNFTGSATQKSLVIGGEGCMWGEWTDDSNVQTNTWPRAAAVGERLWSSEGTRDMADARARLAAFSCELNRRGLASAPFAQGPSFCTDESRNRAH